MERTCQWTDGLETWEAACGWGSWVVPFDSRDNRQYGFCGGCGGRIVLITRTTDDLERQAETAATAAAGEGR